jgi:1-acyl-sn-glycerol-3-phosphate acyltransferase
MFKIITTYFYIQLVMLYNIVIQSLLGVYSRLNTIESILNFFDVELSIKTDDIIYSNTKVILSNHKTFADFFIDGYIIGSNVCYLSRIMVVFAVPMTSLYAIITNIIYFFNSNSTSESKMDKIIKNITQDRILLLYPEGTRNPSNNIIPLKRDALKSIYNQNLQIQIMNISNKEKVFNEKKMILTKNVKCNILFSSSIVPSEYNTFDLFYEKISDEWIKLWKINSNYIQNNIKHFTPTKEHYLYSKITILFFPFICCLIVLYNLRTFIYFIHIFYIGLIICWTNISRIDKNEIKTFIKTYNNLQILLSGLMSIIGLYIFMINFNNPLLLNDYEPNSLIQNYLLLHAFSKILDFIDTVILIVTNKPFFKP